MKIGISSTGPSLNDQVDARFGRCDTFIIVDPATMDFEAIPNQNVSSTSGAGISSAQLMVEKGVEVVLTGNLGPKAADVFNASGIRIVTGVSGAVGDAAQHYAEGADVTRPTSNQRPVAAGVVVPDAGNGMGSGKGMGGGGGRGMGSGGGRGMGGGGGRGMGGGCRQNGGGGRGMGMGRGRSMGGGRGMRNS